MRPSLEKGTSRLDAVKELEATGDGKPELIHTPGMGAIADICSVPEDGSRPTTSSAWRTWL